MSRIPSTSKIEQFLRIAYTDADLMFILGVAEAGELNSMDARHCLLGMANAGYSWHRKAKIVPGAEREFIRLHPGLFWWTVKNKRILSARMLPRIHAEITRRSNLRSNLNVDGFKRLHQSTNQEETTA